ncbi:30S ribosomal protein S1, partial [bacterium]
EDFAQLYEESIRDLKEREVVTGSVIGVSEDGVLVDVGYKSEGIIPRNQFEDENGEMTVAVGDVVEVFLEKKEDSEGLIYLSKEKADKMKVWNDIGKAYDENQPVLGKIISRIKGGLTVDIGVKAFLPGSQVDIRPIRNLDRLVNEEFYFKIIKFNPRRGNVVLSRRVLLEQERESKKEETLKILEEDNVMEGIVKNITDYGAFIDLGGIDGLLHITDLSWGRMQHPSEILTVGEKINVKVLKFDRDKERVSLGMKQLTEDPWEGVPGRYPVGSQVQGKIVSITDYGAFVKLEDGVEGLVHISEMTWNRKIKHPSKLVEIGDLVDAEVLSIDTENRRISLGMKQVEPNPWEVVAEKYPTGSIIEGKVRTLTDFGAFVGLEEGIDGLIHVSDMSWIQKVNHPTELLKKGDSVRAVVLSVDKARERLSLGLKQLTPNPWEEIGEKFPIGSTVVGKVVSHADFGTFVQVMDGIEGLIHVSEMGLDDGQNAEEAYPPGSEVDVKVLSIDPEERKVSLSISATKEKPDSGPFTSYLNNSDGGGTLGDILGESLAAQKSDADQPEEEAALQEGDAEEPPSEAAEVEEVVEVEVEAAEDEEADEEIAAKDASEEVAESEKQADTEEEQAIDAEEKPAEEAEEEEEEEKTS